jgi:hypothetical protein
MEVQFDTHGIGDCPKGKIVTFDDCRQCPNYQGYFAFTVYCGIKQTRAMVCATCLDQKCFTGSLCIDCMLEVRNGNLSYL